jgi:cytochrome c oxidase subunit 2
MILAFALIMLAVGSVVFHLVSPWWWTPIASNWGYIDDTIIITFWITGVVFIAIILFMAYCLFRFRHKKGTQAAYEPENKKLEWWLTVLTSVGVAGMLAPGLFVWNQFVTVPKEADVVEVIGQQWQWNFRLPGKDGVLGTSDTRNVSPENPLGLNPNDPSAQDDVLIEGQDLHLPLNRPVKVLLRSIDTIHDFYVPQFRAKMDIVPGMVTYFWFTPTRAGKFESICAELCGTGHYTMRAVVVVDEDSAYQTWLQGQSTFKQALAKNRNSTGSKLSLALSKRQTGSADSISGMIPPKRNSLHN